MEQVINFIKNIIENLNGFGFPFLVFFIGVLEFSFGLYKVSGQKMNVLLILPALPYQDW